MTSSCREAPSGIRAALEACPRGEFAEFHAAFAAALSRAARTGEDADLRAVLDRWRPGPPPTP